MSAADSEHDDALADSGAWLSALREPGRSATSAIARLHELLLRAARFEVSRRRAALSHVRGEELDDLALQAADDALVAVLGKLDDYRGASRFTTWAYKFACSRPGAAAPTGLAGARGGARAGGLAADGRRRPGSPGSSRSE